MKEVRCHEEAMLYIPGQTRLPIMLKKLFLGLCGLFAIVVIIVVLFGSQLLDRTVRKGVTSYGPQLTQTSVTLGHAQVSPWNGEGTLRELVIGNPEGFRGDYAMRLPEASVSIAMKSMLTDTVVIRRISIDRPEVHLETSGGTLNLRRIQQNVREAVDDGEPSPAEPSEPGKKFIIEEFVLEGGRITMDQVDRSVTLPTVRLKDIGAAKGGIPADEALQAIIDAVLREASSIFGDQLSNILENPEATLRKAQSITERVQGLFGGGRKDDPNAE